MGNKGSIVYKYVNSHNVTRTQMLNNSSEENEPKMELLGDT